MTEYRSVASQLVDATVDAILPLQRGYLNDESAASNCQDLWIGVSCDVLLAS